MGGTWTEVEYEIHCDDECVAITFGDDAETEAWRYAGVYSQDGVIKVYMVTKTYEPIG